MNSLAIEFAIFLGLAFLSGALAMAEAAIVAASKGKLSALAEGGNARAKAALALADNPAEFKETVQFGIAFLGIIAGVFGGATVAGGLLDQLVAFGIPVNIATPISYLVVVSVITALSVVIGELVPKQIGLSHPERTVLILARPVYLLSRICRPIVWMLSLLGRLVTGALPFSVEHRSDVSEDDIRHMIAQGAASGEIDVAEKEIAFRVFRLGDRPIRAYITARNDVVWIEASTPFSEIWTLALNSPHSFFPVAHEDLDNILGVVSIKDLCIMSSDTSLSIHDFIRPILQVPSTKDALAVLEDFKQERKHMAVVIDEDGSVEGVVTTHDLLEAIVGDLADYEGEESSIVQRNDGSYLVDAALDVQELLLHLGVKDREDATGYNSVGGVVFGEFGTVPKVGMSVSWNGLNLEVVDMDGYRIDKLLVTTIPTDTESTEKN